MPTHLLNHQVFYFAWRSKGYIHLMRAKGVIALIAVSIVAAGCGGSSNQISPAAGVPDYVDFGDHVETLDGSYASGTLPVTHP